MLLHGALCDSMHLLALHACWLAEQQLQSSAEYLWRAAVAGGACPGALQHGVLPAAAVLYLHADSP